MCIYNWLMRMKLKIDQPPRRELKVSDPDSKVLSLADLGLAPSSVLLVRFQTEAYNSKDLCCRLRIRIITYFILNYFNYFTSGTVLPPPLLPQILQQAVPLPGTAEADRNAANSVSSASATPSRPKIPSTGEKKIPKWFKIGQKK